ncbi:hypothetical protein EDB89DRAFT_395175 [Lactarius sanguifluus]|nr:hypothetical protein EDB89DRAFT_395175 [Lactarius sanguifluus]
MSEASETGLNLFYLEDKLTCACHMLDTAEHPLRLLKVLPQCTVSWDSPRPCRTCRAVTTTSLDRTMFFTNCPCPFSCITALTSAPCRPGYVAQHKTARSQQPCPAPQRCAGLFVLVVGTLRPTGPTPYLDPERRMAIRPSSQPRQRHHNAHPTTRFFLSFLVQAATQAAKSGTARSDESALFANHSSPGLSGTHRSTLRTLLLRLGTVGTPRMCGRVLGAQAVR